MKVGPLECDGSQVHPTSALPSIPAPAVEAAESLALQYKKQRDALLEFIQNAPVSSGVCCCGAEINKSSYCDNHSSVDQWDHSVEGWVKAFAKFDNEVLK